ncbi:putative membrane protein [Limibacillus halophilus]|uniref:Putative membrane protein n=2 Tax=Limibacillus halophilus TaxID=1579333 RepID=A0A839SV71_9PROT|nr:putative membrane protein [Limibacillus halophilus]
MMAALAGEKAIREESVPSPSFETPSARAPQDEGETENSEGLKAPHPEGPSTPRHNPHPEGSSTRRNNPHPEEGSNDPVSKGGDAGSSGAGSPSQAAAKPQDDPVKADPPQSDPPTDFDAERNEATTQADAQERESDLQPFGEATRRNLEDVERAQADLEHQRQRQRAILEQSAEERDDPATRPQRQQAVAKDIEEAQRNLGKAQVKARDDILEHISQGNIGDEEAFGGAQAIFGKDAPPTRQVAIAIWAKNSQQESFSNPTRAGEAGDLIDDLLGRAGTKGDLSDEAVEFFNDKQEKLNELKTQAASVIEAQAESDRLNGEIDALRRDLIGTGDPGRRTKLERELSEKAAALGAASDALSNTRDVYETAAADFGKLQAANNLAKLVEASDPQTARNQVLDLAKAVRDNVVGGGIAGAAIGSSGAGPAGGVVGGAFGSFLGVVSAVTGNLAARAALSADDLEALPRLLAEDPKAAIEVIDKIGDAELVSLLAGSLVGGISTTSRSGFSIIDALAGASAAKVSEKLFK